MIDDRAIAQRAQQALQALRMCLPGAAVKAEQVLTHDVTSLINEIAYLRRQLAHTQGVTARTPKVPCEG